MLDLVERWGAGDPVTGSSGKWVRSGGRVAAGRDGVGVAGVGGGGGAALGTWGVGWPLCYEGDGVGGGRVDALAIRGSGWPLLGRRWWDVIWYPKARGRGCRGQDMCNRGVVVWGQQVGCVDKWPQDTLAVSSTNWRLRRVRRPDPWSCTVYCDCVGGSYGWFQFYPNFWDERRFVFGLRRCHQYVKGPMDQWLSWHCRLQYFWHFI